MTTTNWKRLSLCLLATAAISCVLPASAAHGQESPNTGSSPAFNSLLSFDNVHGAEPRSTLVQGPDGNFYGTTYTGGINGTLCQDRCGVAFKITPAGTLTILHDFCSQASCTDGHGPEAGLVLATDGNFYGVTTYGGVSATCPNGCGTVFVLTPGGTLTTVHAFGSSEGNYPFGSLMQATDGNFYGTTQAGGTAGAGTVYKITPGGTVTVLYSFCTMAKCADGDLPRTALVQGSDGTFYGVGGNSVFKITSAGSFTLLHEFTGPDGYGAYGGLVEAADGNFYGTTTAGGTNGLGTFFQVTSSGTLTTLHDFTSAEGGGSNGALALATDGNFYGISPTGVFEVTPSGTVTVLHTFGATEGSMPLAGLLQATDGSFYGETFLGGAVKRYCFGTFNGCGTVFNASVGLAPFVATVPTSGAIGRRVRILGTDLTGATSVTFNGVSAAFTVASATEITATVPAGAITGTVQVETPSGKLLSNIAFRIP